MLEEVKSASIAELKRMEIHCLFTIDHCKKYPNSEEILKQQEELLQGVRQLIARISKLLDCSI
jgi:hypothetical protein